MHKHIITNSDVKTIQWYNNPCPGYIYIYIIINIKYNKWVYFIKDTNISMKTPVYNAQTYQHQCRYKYDAVSESLMHSEDI